MENGMLVELRRRARRDRFLYTFRVTVPTRQDVLRGGQVIKMLLAVAVLFSLGRLAGPAMAQSKQGEAFSGEISSQCAHRRIMAPNLREGCAPKLRSDAQLGYEQRQSGNEQGELGSWLGQFGPWPGANQQPDRRDEEQPKAHRERRKSSTPPKVVAAHPLKAKKASTPPRLAAQKEQQLYQEFLEWRNRQLFFE
jgi:hypothetical protein